METMDQKDEIEVGGGQGVEVEVNSGSVAMGPNAAAAPARIEVPEAEEIRLKAYAKSTQTFYDLGIAKPLNSAEWYVYWDTTKTICKLRGLFG